MFYFHHPCFPISGTKTHPPRYSLLISPFVVFVALMSSWLYLEPTGMSNDPLGLSCSISGFGISGAAAVTIILSYGASSVCPCVPSPVMTLIFMYPAFLMFSLACCASVSIFSTVLTDPSFKIWDMTQLWYPVPAPISSTFSSPCSLRASLMIATMCGADIVCFLPIGIG